MESKEVQKRKWKISKRQEHPATPSTGGSQFGGQLANDLLNPDDITKRSTLQWGFQSAAFGVAK
ncbi:unnamed protein product [Dovyalis caffra]|uniref:Uncharacterized protein n=1 Tax=Dovyalis caffra TaxID=77055 RepID=A0AAV1R2X9_9ROSI|nr:unnamed protein product [Dovyalis caffra]